MSIIQIGKAIHSILTSSAQVRSYLGSKIYPIVAEEKTTFPFMVYRRDSIAEQFSKDSKYQETASFEVVIVDPDYNKAATIADVVKEKDLRIAELERMLKEAKNRNHSLDDYDDNEEDHGNASERGTLDKKTRIELNLEARNAAKDYLDSLENYDCSDWNPNIGNGLVKGIVKYKDKTITVVVTSSIGRKLYLHPRLFSELMIDPDNLLLNYGYDRRIHRISFDETFQDNKDVNLVFDTDIITPDEFAYLANRYKYSKKTCFVIENITYSISEQIKGFGLDEKMSDSDVYTNIDTDELFDF